MLESLKCEYVSEEEGQVKEDDIADSSQALQKSKPLLDDDQCLVDFRDEIIITISP